MKLRKTQQMKIIIKRGKGKQPFYFVIVAGNGKIIATSEMYKQKQSAVKTSASLCYAEFLWYDKT